MGKAAAAPHIASTTRHERPTMPPPDDRRLEMPRRAALRAAIVLPLALPLAGFQSFEALFAPSAELWDRWQAHDPTSGETIDHSAWDRLLAAYLRPDGAGVQRFAYAEVSGSDKAALGGYLDTLAAVPVSRHNRAEQFAYWVNLYNALTVKVILDHYPVESIRDIDISPGLFADGPWDKSLVTVEGEAVSLNDIEHRILRPIWNDPRIHYAVNCASIGCPDLRGEAFTGSDLERQLDEAARAYVNHPRGARVVDGKLVLSSIYVWFGEDFGGGEEQIVAHLRRYAGEELTAALDGVSEIDDHAYDWTLNDAVSRP